jgi:hypothetical protein
MIIALIAALTVVMVTAMLAAPHMLKEAHAHVLSKMRLADELSERNHQRNLAELNAVREKSPLELETARDDAAARLALAKAEQAREEQELEMEMRRYR